MSLILILTTCIVKLFLESNGILNLYLLKKTHSSMIFISKLRNSILSLCILTYSWSSTLRSNASKPCKAWTSTLKLAPFLMELKRLSRSQLVTINSSAMLIRFILTSMEWSIKLRMSKVKVKLTWFSNSWGMMVIWVIQPSKLSGPFTRQTQLKTCRWSRFWHLKDLLWNASESSIKWLSTETCSLIMKSALTRVETHQTHSDRR